MKSLKMLAVFFSLFFLSVNLQPTQLSLQTHRFNLSVRIQAQNVSPELGISAGEAPENPAKSEQKTGDISRRVFGGLVFQTSGLLLIEPSEVFGKIPALDVLTDVMMRNPQALAMLEEAAALFSRNFRVAPANFPFNTAYAENHFASLRNAIREANENNTSEVKLGRQDVSERLSIVTARLQEIKGFEAMLNEGLQVRLGEFLYDPFGFDVSLEWRAKHLVSSWRSLLLKQAHPLGRRYLSDHISKTILHDLQTDSKAAIMVLEQILTELMSGSFPSDSGIFTFNNWYLANDIISFMPPEMAKIRFLMELSSKLNYVVSNLGPVLEGNTVALRFLEYWKKIKGPMSHLLDEGMRRYERDRQAEMLLKAEKRRGRTRETIQRRGHQGYEKQDKRAYPVQALDVRRDFLGRPVLSSQELTWHSWRDLIDYLVRARNVSSLQSVSFLQSA